MGKYKEKEKRKKYWITKKNEEIEKKKWKRSNEKGRNRGKDIRNLRKEVLKEDWKWRRFMKNMNKSKNGSVSKRKKNEGFFTD